MSNTPRIRDRRARLGTVALETDSGGRVVLRAVPPGGAEPVEVLMLPSEARDLAGGLVEAAAQAESEQQ